MFHRSTHGPWQTRHMLRRLLPPVLAVIFTLGLLAPPAAAQADADATVEDVSVGVRDSVVRLYEAAFDRAPDGEGLAYWVDRYVGGLPLERIAEQFMASAEWRGRYGATDDPTFVGLVYGNVLDRVPDDAGRAYWEGVLGSGTSRTDVLLGFSESPEFVIKTGTATPEAPPRVHPPVPDGSGSGRRIVYSDGAQRIWVIDAAEIVVDSYLVSGRDNVPPKGNHRVFSKSPLAWAGHDGITMEHMVRFYHGGRLPIGFHSIPRYADGTPMQTVEELGTYQSAGCIRQRDDQAEWLYNWVEIGDLVVVVS